MTVKMPVQSTSIAVSLLILSTLSTIPAHASDARVAGPEQPLAQTETQTVVADANAALSFERPIVSSAAAPQTAEVPVASIQPVDTTPSEVVPTATTSQAPAQAQAPQPVAAPVVAPAAVPVTAPKGGGNNLRSALVSAAYAQLGVHQDCTMLVTNSLAAVGIYYHGWPAGYLSLGHVVPASAAQPGDLAYYVNGGEGLAHIAVYVGNGMAIHGGWEGQNTALATVNVGSGPVFIRIDK